MIPNQPDISPGRTRTLPKIQDEDWNIFNQLRKKYHRSWADVFRAFKFYQPPIEIVLALDPDEITKVMATGTHTATNLMPMWCENIRENMPYITDRSMSNDIKTLEAKFADKNIPAIVVGAGPSLYDNASGTNHLEVLENSDYNGVIIATDRILKDCYDHGIFPDYVVTVDGSDKIEKFYDNDIVKGHGFNTTAILANHTHPSIVNHWLCEVGGNVLFYTASIPQEIMPNASSVMGLITDNTEINSGGNSGSFALNIAHYMQCNPIALIGIDMSYKTSTPISETQYYQSYKQQTGKTDEQLWEEKVFQVLHHPFFDTDCIIDFMYLSYLEPLRDFWIPEFKKLGNRVISCVEGGALFGDNIEYMYFNDFLEEFGGGGD